MYYRLTYSLKIYENAEPKRWEHRVLRIASELSSLDFLARKFSRRRAATGPFWKRNLWMIVVDGSRVFQGESTLPALWFINSMVLLNPAATHGLL